MLNIFLATAGFTSNKLIQQLEVGVRERRYLDIVVTGALDINKFWINVRTTAIPGSHGEGDGLHGTVLQDGGKGHIRGEGV